MTYLRQLTINLYFLKITNEIIDTNTFKELQDFLEKLNKLTKLILEISYVPKTKIHNDHQLYNNDFNKLLNTFVKNVK